MNGWLIFRGLNDPSHWYFGETRPWLRGFQQQMENRLRGGFKSCNQFTRPEFSYGVNCQYMCVYVNVISRRVGQQLSRPERQRDIQSVRGQARQAFTWSFDYTGPPCGPLFELLCSGLRYAHTPPPSKTKPCRGAGRPS